MTELRKLTVEVVTISEDRSFKLNDNVVGVTVENVGTATAKIGWNAKALGVEVIPGASKSYGLGFPYVFNEQKLNIAFASGSDKRVEVTIIYDNGPVKC